MLKGVGVVCFSACYLIALILEVARLRLTKESRSLAIVSFLLTVFGAIAHGAFLYHNDLLQNDHFFASVGGWFSVLAFTVVLVDLYLGLVSKTQFSLFLLTLALALTGVSVGAGNAAFTPTATCLCVRATHAFSLLLATLLAFFGAVCGGMYFWQRSRLRKNVANTAFTLPSLEWLSRSCRFAANLSVVALGIGVASGFYLKIFSGAQSQTDIASVGTPLLFALALLSRFPKRRAQAVDVCSINAVHNFVVVAVLIVLLLFAAFGPRSHWKPLTHPENNAESSDDNDVAFASPPSER